MHTCTVSYRTYTSVSEPERLGSGSGFSARPRRYRLWDGFFHYKWDGIELPRAVQEPVLQEPSHLEQSGHSFQ